MVSDGCDGKLVLGTKRPSIFVIDTYEHAYPETGTLTKEYTRLRAILILNDIMIFTAWLYTRIYQLTDLLPDTSSIHCTQVKMHVQTLNIARLAL